MLTDFKGGDVNAFAGSYSPDGKWIVYRLADRDTYSLVKMRPDGTHVRTILTVPGLAPRFIDWGPRRSDDPDER
jgi:Tol biopolymer transport system component